MANLVTLLPTESSNALNTASLKKAPPCTTTCSPKSSTLLIFITLYKALRTTEYERPAEISLTEAPSFCACLTFEFINTVHLEPKSTGCSALSAVDAKS